MRWRTQRYVRYRTAMNGNEAVPPPLPEDTVYMTTFRRARAALGSAENVARALGASVMEIEAWTDGRLVPPPGAFLLAIDIAGRAGELRPAPGKP
jgi:hypothetical protein